MSSVLVLLLALLLPSLVALIGMIALCRRRRSLRWPGLLLVHLVTLLLLAGGRRRGLQPVDDHSTGDGSENQGARNQDCPDQSKSVKQASHQVITNYQRRSRSERSIKSFTAHAPTM